MMCTNANWFHRIQLCGFAILLVFFTVSCAQEHTKDGGDDDDSSSVEEDDVESDIMEMIPLDEQPGYKEWPYGACISHDVKDEICPENTRACGIDSKHGDFPEWSVCFPVADENDECPPMEGYDVRLFPGAGCYIQCDDPEKCPPGMVCRNHPGTPTCAWPILYEEE